MKLPPSLFALVLIAALAAPAPEAPAQATAPASRRDNAVTSINDRGAAQARPSAPAPSAEPGETFSIRSTGAAGSRGAQPEKGGMNLLDLIRSGGWAMYVLAFFSVVTVMLVLAYLFTLRRSAILTPHFMNTADVLLKKRDYLGLLAISSRHSEVVARIVQRTLDFVTKNPGASFETVRDIAETEGGAQAASLQHRITYLADIGVIAPMVGLLGTVVGIISAFAKLGSGEATISRDILLASGVSEALIATAAGLILGITAFFFFSIFRNRVHSLISDMEIASAHILGLLATGFGKKREPSRVAVEEEF